MNFFNNFFFQEIYFYSNDKWINIQIIENLNDELKWKMKIISKDKNIKLWIKNNNEFINNKIINNAHGNSIIKVIYFSNGN